MNAEHQSSIDGRRVAAPGGILIAAIALVALATWLPSLQPYVPAAEDFGRADVADPSMAGYWTWLVAHSEREGLWRVIGLPFTSAARNLHPLGFPLLSLGFHTANGILVAVLLLRLRCSRLVSLVAALMFVTLPSAVEANMYAVASQSIQATTVFLLLACHLAGAVGRGTRRRASLLLCFAAAFIGNATQENLLFAYLLLPAAVAFIHRPIRQWQKAQVQWVLEYTFFIALAVVTYASITLEMRVAPSKEMVLNLRTLISFPVHQYTNLIPFDIWNHPDLVEIAIKHQSVVVALISATLLAAGLFAARLAVTEIEEETPEGIAREWRLMIAVAAMWHAAGWIYVLAGGYSFESRKKYVTLLFLVAIVAVVAAWLVRGSRPPAGRSRVRAAIFAGVALSATTTWLIASLWVIEARRGAALMEVIAAQPQVTELRVRFTPNLYQVWPRWRYLASSQHNADWVTVLETLWRFNRDIKLVPQSVAGAPEVECHYLGLSAKCEFFDVPSPSP